MPGRSNGAKSYVYGFNGKRKDNDIYGQDNAYDFGDRIQDPRIGRWLSLDPLRLNYPKNNNMLKVLKFCFLFSIFTGCKERDNFITPISIKVYCWSFFSCDDTIDPFSLTSTQISIVASQIMQRQNLVFSDSNIVTSSSLYNLLINRKGLEANKTKLGPDARFVIELNYKERNPDTLVYNNKTSFYLNNSAMLYYKFPVLDSIEKILNVSCFRCRYP